MKSWLNNIIYFLIFCFTDYICVEEQADQNRDQYLHEDEHTMSDYLHEDEETMSDEEVGCMAFSYNDSCRSEEEHSTGCSASCRSEAELSADYATINDLDLLCTEDNFVLDENALRLEPSFDLPTDVTIVSEGNNNCHSIDCTEETFILEQNELRSNPTPDEDVDVDNELTEMQEEDLQNTFFLDPASGWFTLPSIQSESIVEIRAVKSQSSLASQCHSSVTSESEFLDSVESGIENEVRHCGEQMIRDNFKDERLQDHSTVKAQDRYSVDLNAFDWSAECRQPWIYPTVKNSKVQHMPPTVTSKLKGETVMTIPAKKHIKLLLVDSQSEQRNDSGFGKGSVSDEQSQFQPPITMQSQFVQLPSGRCQIRSASHGNKKALQWSSTPLSKEKSLSIVRGEYFFILYR